MKKRFMWLLTTFAATFLLGGVLAGCTPTEETPPEETPGTEQPGDPENPNPPDEPNPPEQPEDGVSSVTVGNVRVQLLSPTLLRVESKGPKGFEDRASYIVTNRDNWETVSYTTKKVGETTVITTDSYCVYVPENATAEDVYVTDEDGVELWNYSDAGNTDTNVYLPSPSDELKSWYFTDSPRIIPSEYGYSVSSNRAPLQGWDFDNDATDVFVFLPQGDYKQFCNDYTDLTGATEMTDLQTLGYWDSRWYAYSSETALQQIHDYLDKGYSIDVLVIDTDWRVGASHGYAINEALFPDMAAFLEECENLGVDICFNDHPEPVTPGNGLDKAEVAYRNEQLTLILSMGLDYWWYDRNWGVCLNSIDPDISVFAFGMYAYQWVTQDYLESIADLNEYAERALIMANVDGCLHGKWTYASDISAHRYSIQWTGDIGSTSTALDQEIYASIFGATEVGIPYMSSDIGGHTQPVTDDMYVRWMQYGALSTICRVHCTHANYIGQEGRMPWMFGETAEEVTKTYIGMRYRLLPLYYALAHENYEDGLPILRRLDIEYPQYVEASRNDEYLLGEYVLVAPIAEAVTYQGAPAGSLTNNGASGLKAEYFNNNNWSGTPVRTTSEQTIGADWGTSGPAGVGSDNFSIRWSGDIKIGNKPTTLTFFADDAIRVYLDGDLVVDGSDVYDTYLSTDVLPANSTHSIVVEYAEFGGNAHVYMYYVEEATATQSASYNTRTVFIPDGTWIDVWSGKRYTGPYTYTVTYPLETSPIFVREGALIALAPDMQNTRNKDWSEMTLDVYPSRNYEAKTTVYEDDTNTVAYKNGEFRTTDITMKYDEQKGVITVTIGAAQGTFSGDRAFEERLWNVRIHTNPGWGELYRAKVNGKTVSLTQTEQSDAAAPFAFSGAAPDGDIYSFLIESSVNEEYVIELYYDDMVDSARNEDYDTTAVDFEFLVEDAGDTVTFSQSGMLDWISYGEDNELGYKRMENGNVFSVAKSYDKNWLTYDSFLVKEFVEDAEESRGASASQKDFAFEIKTAGKTAYYVIYLGGNQSTAKISVRDRAGNVQTQYFGNIAGSYLRRVVIEVTGEEESTLYVTYSMLASETNGTGSPSNVSIACVLASETLPEKIVHEDGKTAANIVSSVTPSAKANLSEAGSDLNVDTLDWKHFGSDGGVSSVQKINGNYIGEVLFRAPQFFYDYPIYLAYNDGQELGAHTGSRQGTCSPGSITISVKVDENVKYIRLYTGTYQSTNIVSVYTRKGTLLAQNEAFSAGAIAEAKIVTIGVNATEEDNLTIMIRSVNEGGGNVSLTGIAVLGTYSGNSNSAVYLQSSAVTTQSYDLTALSYQDWKHFGSADEKANADLIGALSAGGHGIYSDLPASISYSDGSKGVASALTSGRAFDYGIVPVHVDETTTEIVLYTSVFEATLGITVIDENGRTLLSIQPYTDTASAMTAVEVHLSVTAIQAETLTIVVYKGGSGGGSSGLAAVAVK